MDFPVWFLMCKILFLSPNHSVKKCTRNASTQSHVLSLILTGCLGLSACSQAAPATDSLRPADSRPPAAANPNRGQPLRVIVRFRQPVAYRAPAFLQGMGEKIHAPVAYVSSVSPDTHVYQIDAKPGQNRADILRSLGNVPEVLSVEADAAAKPF
ncbi:hypothetical protein POHY109586_08455 [Polaromonas hydrogenivorans]